MTLLKILRIFLDHSDLPLRPSHIAKIAKRPEATVYRALRILESAKLIIGSDGIYYLDPKTSKEHTASLDRHLAMLDILRILFNGRSYTIKELVSYTGKQLLGNAIKTLESIGFIQEETPTLPMGKSLSRVTLAPKVQLALANSQFQREKFRRIYGN